MTRLPTLSRAWTALRVALGTALAGAVLLGSTGAAGADETVQACGFAPNYIFEALTVPGIQAQASCPDGQLLLVANSPLVIQGQGAIWQASTPANLVITAAAIPAGTLTSQYVNAGSSGDYGGDFYWDGGTSLITPGQTSASFTGLASRHFGFLLVCGKRVCDSSNYGLIRVLGVLLSVRELSGPELAAPTGLWQATGWIRGTWTLSFSGDSPTGMCSLSASLANQPLPGSSFTPDPAIWHQCAAPAVSDTIPTTQYPQGAQSLQIAGTDAAGASTSATKTLQIDNQPPAIALSGPSQAASTAGTQYVTATATAGPSGVAGISCSLDGQPAQWFAAATAQVPVSGVGEHQVTCVAENNAVDPSGSHGVSPTATFAMTIATPTVAAITFSRLVDPLRCRQSTQRVPVPGGWMSVGRGHRRVRRPAHTKTIKLTKCHPRTVRQRQTVWVSVRRHGRHVRIKRSRIVRVVVLPHIINQTAQRVPHGNTATVSGWLGTYNGQPLADQPVQVLAAPDNGSGQFTAVAGATTATNGTWSATIPPGPSRLIQAVYVGAPNLMASSSTTVTETVPAKVRLISVTPRRVAWGQTVRLIGQLVGGYLPPGGALVRLRIGQGTAVSTYGVREHITGSGRFTTTYTFGVGDPATHRSYWFQIASLPIGAYPWAPATSRKITILVGGHPHPCCRSRHFPKMRT